jgi:hypothetical protein
MPGRCASVCPSPFLSHVRFDGATRTYEGMVRLATFYDPDENALMLYEELQRS